MHQTRPPHDPPPQQQYPPQEYPDHRQYPPRQRPQHYGPPQPARDSTAVMTIVAIAAVALALGIGFAVKVGAVRTAGKSSVPDDRTCRLLLLQSAWKETTRGREFVWSFHASGELGITTWDEEAEEKISAIGSWKVEKGHLHYSIHYSDDEEWIRTGPLVEKLTAFGTVNSGDVPVMSYLRTSGDAGPVGQATSGTRMPAWD